jgi:hypothetical protein
MDIQTLRWRGNGYWQVERAGAPPDTRADLVLYFGATDLLASGEPAAALAARYPGALIAGCSAGSQILQADVEDDGALAVAVRFAATRVRAAVEPIREASQSRACGAQLAQALKGEDLAAVFVLSDGLAVNGTLLVEGLVSVLGSSVPISGGLAGDGARFERTLVGLGDTPQPGRVVAIGLYGTALRISHAAVGGWDAFGPPRTITRAVGNVLYELDGKPALDLYERYLGDEAAGLPGTALLYPLRIWDAGRDGEDLVRTVLAVDHVARSMTFAGDLPQGWSAQLMRGSHDRLVAGAARAAADASASLDGAGDGCKLALLVSCVGRRLLMGGRTSEEVEAVGEALGEQVTQLGFYSYGEIAPRESAGRCDLHNQTMTVTMIAEATA